MLGCFLRGRLLHYLTKLDAAHDAAAVPHPDLDPDDAASRHSYHEYCF